MPLETRGGFTSFFVICMSFSSLSCLTAQSRTSRTMLNTGDESGHPCFAPDLKGKVFSFTTEYISCETFVDAFYQREEIPSISS